MPLLPFCTRSVGLLPRYTKQKLAEEALRKSENLALAGRLVATIAHEINNPLEAVTNLLYLLRISTQDPEARQYVVVAEEELNRISQIVTQFLRFHRQSTVPQWKKMSLLLDSAAALFKSRMVPEHIVIERNYRDRSLVWSYGSELRQIFGNLVGNAFDALRHGGTLYLRTREARDLTTGKPGIRVTVADEGQNIDAETLACIADRSSPPKAQMGQVWAFG